MPQPRPCRYGADGDEVTRTAMAAIQQEEQEQRRQSKAAKKAAFNEAYDEGAAGFHYELFVSCQQS